MDKEMNSEYFLIKSLIFFLLNNTFIFNIENNFNAFPNIPLIIFFIITFTDNKELISN